MKHHWQDIIKKILLVIIISASSSNAQALGGGNVDFARAYAWTLYGESVRKMMIAQDGQQMLISGNHIYMKDQNDKLIDLQNEINNYLSEFHDILNIAAQCYGMYYEISEVTRNLSMIQDALNDNPEGIISSAFMGERSKIYLRLITSSLNLLNDVRRIFTVQPDILKMTDKERIQQLDKIRKRIKEINGELHGIAVLIRYTNMNDVLYKIIKLRKRFIRRTNAEIAQECLTKWRAHFKIDYHTITGR